MKEEPIEDGPVMSDATAEGPEDGKVVDGEAKATKKPWSDLKEQRRKEPMTWRRLPRPRIPYYKDLKTLMTHEYTILSVLGAIIGILSAISAWVFRRMIDYMRMAFTGIDPSKPFFANSLADYPFGYWTIIGPAIGGLIVGLIIYNLAPEVGGHGIPAVMEAVSVKGGRMRKRVIVVEALASSIAIGSGGSVGREGPMVQISGGLGSAVAQYLKLPAGWARILIACGATGAITASFNTPIAGVVFALEIILFEFKAKSFIPLVITSVFSKMLAIMFFGNNPAFDLSKGLVDSYVLVSNWELLLYLLLGVACGIVSIVFVKSMNAVHKLFDKWSTKPYVKTCMGGACIGIIALLFPQVMGIGYETVDLVLKGRTDLIPLYLLIALLLVKVIATSISLGSGSSGGIFSPSLFVGAMVGGVVGNLVNSFFPGLTGPQGAYAIVGMAALFAGVSRATFTSIIIVFEMTLNYNLILPVMFACVVSDVVSSVFMKESIFTTDLAKKGIRIVHDMGVNILQAMTVRDAMVAADEVTSVTENTSIGEVYSRILRTEHMGFPVKDRKGRCIGIITFHDVDKAISKGGIAEPVKWHFTKSPVVAYCDETLEEALMKMEAGDVGHLPVVHREDKACLEGFITKGDILRKYAEKQKEMK